MSSFLKNIGNRFLSVPLIGGALFLMTQSCSPAKNITYSNAPDADSVKTELDIRNDSIKSAHYRENHFYKYNDSLNWTSGKQNYVHDIAYRHGKIREHAIFPNEKMKNPTKEQIYLQNLTDIAQKSDVGKDAILSIQKENVVVYADTTNTATNGYYMDNRISNTLRGFNDTTLNKKEQSMAHAIHVTTILEEFIHAKDFLVNGVALDTNSEIKLNPASSLLRTYSTEAAAKTNVIIAMHQLKENGEEDLWEYALEAEQNNVMGRMMEHYGETINEHSTQQEKLNKASKIYKIILNDPGFRSVYFDQAINDIKYNKNSTFRHIPQSEIERAGNIPGTSDNFIENAKNMGILSNTHVFSPQQKDILEKRQKEVQEVNPNFVPDVFTENELGGYTLTVPTNKKASTPAIKN